MDTRSRTRSGKVFKTSPGAGAAAAVPSVASTSSGRGKKKAEDTKKKQPAEDKKIVEAAEPVEVQPKRSNAKKQVPVASSAAKTTKGKGKKSKDEEPKEPEPEVEEKTNDLVIDEPASKKTTAKATGARGKKKIEPPKEPEPEEEEEDVPEQPVVEKPKRGRASKAEPVAKPPPKTVRSRRKVEETTTEPEEEEKASDTVTVDEKKDSKKSTTTTSTARGRNKAGPSKEPQPEEKAEEKTEEAAEVPVAEIGKKTRGTRAQKEKPVVEAPVKEDKKTTRGRGKGKKESEEDKKEKDAASSVNEEPVASMEVEAVQEKPEDKPAEAGPSSSAEVVPEAMNVDVPDTEAVTGMEVDKEVTKTEAKPEEATDATEVKKKDLKKQNQDTGSVQSQLEKKTDAVKRKVEEEEEEEEESTAKKAKLEVVIPRVSLPSITGKAMSCGADEGEGAEALGFRKKSTLRRRPTVIEEISSESSLVVAGACHSVVVSADGSKVYTFGVNDEAALGRDTGINDNGFAAGPDGNPSDPDKTELVDEETAAAIPSPVALNETIVKVTAGDSHTAALTSSGKVYLWGCFRAQTGKVGLQSHSAPALVQRPVLGFPEDQPVSDIASGDNHVLILTEKGEIYSVGIGEQGQLGRLKEEDSKVEDKTFENIANFLTPKKITSPSGQELDVKFERIWASSSSSFARSVEKQLYSWGLNNYSQLGFNRNLAVPEGDDSTDHIVEYFPQVIPSFSRNASVIKEVAGGQHHTLFCDENGLVYSVGRGHYGRLGHGNLNHILTEPQVIEALSDKKVVSISCGLNCSFAVTEDGKFSLTNM